MKRLTMKRLTRRVDGSVVFPSELVGVTITPDNEYMYALLQHLAAYEETGLEPEDIKRAFNEAAVLKLAGQALGITPDRLRELAQADREGRCVVLPCKIGGTVYSIRHERVPDDDYRMSFHTEMRIVSQKFGLIHADCIGKSVFLTREAAEAALRREQG